MVLIFCLWHFLNYQKLARLTLIIHLHQWSFASCKDEYDYYSIRVMLSWLIWKVYCNMFNQTKSVSFICCLYKIISQTISLCIYSIPSMIDWVAQSIRSRDSGWWLLNFLKHHNVQFQIYFCKENTTFYYTLT